MTEAVARLYDGKRMMKALFAGRSQIWPSSTAARKLHLHWTGRGLSISLDRKPVVEDGCWAVDPKTWVEIDPADRKPSELWTADFIPGTWLTLDAKRDGKTILDGKRIDLLYDELIDFG